MKVSGRAQAPAVLPHGNSRGTHWLGTGCALEPVWMIWRRENLLFQPGIKPRFLARPSRSLVAISTELCRLFVFPQPLILPRKTQTFRFKQSAHQPHTTTWRVLMLRMVEMVSRC
jgi:hypothetical protein